MFSMFFLIGGCGGGGGGGTGSPSSTYTVTYNGNGNTGGSVPTDSSTYQQGGSVTILGNTGSLVDSGYTFSGWTTASDGSGTVYTAGQTLTVGTANITLYAKWAAANVLGYAYAVNYNGGGLGSIAQYTIASDGSLHPMSTPTVSAAGNDTQFLSADPSGKYIYVSNITSNTVGQFTIGSDGALTVMSTPTVAMGDLSGGKLYYPMGSVVHQTGDNKLFYVTNNQKGTVNAFTLDTTGSLTSMTTTTLTDPFDASNPKQAIAPYAIAIDSTGKYAYVCSQVGNSTANAIISQFNINQTTGALEYNSTMMMGATYITPYDIKIASIASGQYVYVTNHQNSTIWEYSINSVDGTLTYIGTISVAAPAHTLAIHPTGKYAYASMFDGTHPDAVIAQLNINQSTGALSLMSTPAISAGGTAAEFIAIDPTGMYAYSTSADSGWGSSTISQFTIDQTTGALTLMSTPTVQTHGTGPCQIVVVWK
jgi:6-phosphogluconolactonase